MRRFMTFVLTGAASLSLIACNQAQKAEVERESESLAAMTEHLRSEAERVANDDGKQPLGEAGLDEGQAQLKSDAIKARADGVGSGK